MYNKKGMQLEYLFLNLKLASLPVPTRMFSNTSVTTNLERSFMFLKILSSKEIILSSNVHRGSNHYHKRNNIFFYCIVLTCHNTFIFRYSVKHVYHQKVSLSDSTIILGILSTKNGAKVN